MCELREHIGVNYFRIDKVFDRQVWFSFFFWAAFPCLMFQDLVLNHLAYTIIYWDTTKEVILIRPSTTFLKFFKLPPWLPRKMKMKGRMTILAFFYQSQKSLIAFQAIGHFPMQILHQKLPKRLLVSHSFLPVSFNKFYTTAQHFGSYLYHY